MLRNKFNILFVATTVCVFSLISCNGDSEKAETTVIDDTVEVAEETIIPEDNLDHSSGEAIYNGKGKCKTCHMENGQGVPPAFPPLANADYLLADKYRAISQALYGSKEPIEVNGISYPGGIMAETIKDVVLTDQEVVNVVNYILNSWGNNGGTVSIADVEEARNLHLE